MNISKSLFYKYANDDNNGGGIGGIIGGVGGLGVGGVGAYYTGKEILRNQLAKNYLSNAGKQLYFADRAPTNSMTFKNYLISRNILDPKKIYKREELVPILKSNVADYKAYRQTLNPTTGEAYSISGPHERVNLRTVPGTNLSRQSIPEQIKVLNQISQTEGNLAKGVTRAGMGWKLGLKAGLPAAGIMLGTGYLGNRLLGNNN